MKLKILQSEWLTSRGIIAAVIVHKQQYNFIILLSSSPMKTVDRIINSAAFIDSYSDHVLSYPFKTLRCCIQLY